MEFWTISFLKAQFLRERFKHYFLHPSSIPPNFLRFGLIRGFLFQVRSFIQQILEGLGHIHSMNILHLDMKVRLLGLMLPAVGVFL